MGGAQLEVGVVAATVFLLLLLEPPPDLRMAPLLRSWWKPLHDLGLGSRQASSGAPHPPQLFSELPLSGSVRNSCQSGVTAEVPYPEDHGQDLSAANAADRRLHLSCYALIEAREWGLCEVDPPWPPRERAVCGDNGLEGRQHSFITTVAPSSTISVSTTRTARLKATAPRCGDGHYTTSHSSSLYGSQLIPHQSMCAASRNGGGHNEAASDTSILSLSDIYNRSEATISGVGTEDVIAERGLPAQSLSSLAAASSALPTPPAMEQSHSRREAEDVCACQCGTSVRYMVIDHARLGDLGRNVTELDAHAMASHDVQVPTLPQETAAEPDCHQRTNAKDQWHEDQRGSATCYVHHDAGSHVGNSSVMQLQGAVEVLRREMNKTQALWKGCEARLRDQAALCEETNLVMTQHPPGTSEVHQDAPVQQFVGRPSGISAQTVQSTPAQTLLALIAMTLRARLRDKEMTEVEQTLRERGEALLLQQAATTATESVVEMLSMQLEEKDPDYMHLDMSLVHAGDCAEHTRKLRDVNKDLRRDLNMRMPELFDHASEIQQLRHALAAANGKIAELQGDLEAMIGEAQQSELEMHKVSTTTPDLIDGCGKLRDQPAGFGDLLHAFTAGRDTNAQLHGDPGRATLAAQQTKLWPREEHDALVVQHRAAIVAAEELVEMLSMQLEEKDADHIALEMSLEYAGAAVEDRTQELREVNEELSIRTWALADADGRQRAQAGEVEQLRDAVTAARGMHAELQEKLERLTVEAQQTELRLREQQEALLVQQVAYEDDVEMLSMLLEEKEVDYLALEMSLEHASAGADGRTRELSETIEDLRLELSMKTEALTDTSGKLREQADEVEQMRHALTAAEDVHAKLQKDLERATSEGQQTEHRLREQHDALVVQHRAAAEELVEMLSMQLEEKDADHIALEMSLEYAGAAVEDRTQELREVNEELSIRTWTLADADGRQRAQAGEVEQLRDAVTAARGMHAELQEKLERLTVEAQQTELRLREQQEALLVQQVATVAYEDDVEMLSMLLEEKEVDYLALEMSLEHASAGADGRTRELSETIEDLRLELSMKTAALTDTSKLREQADEVEQMRHALTAAEDVHAKLQKDLERATSEGQQAEHRLHEQHDALGVQHRAAAVAAEELVEMLSMQLEEKDADHIALEMSLEHAGAAVEDRTQELREVNEELSIRTWTLADADGRQRAQAGEVEQLRDAVTAARGMHAELQEKLERLTVEAQQTELRLREQQEALLVQQVAYEDDVEMLSMLLEEKEVDYLALEMSLEHASAGADGRTRELSETIEDLRLELSMKTAALTDTSGKLREQADEVEQMRHALTAAEDVHAKLQKDLERATSEGQQTEHRLHEQHDALVVQHRAAAVAAEELVEMLSMQLEEKDSDHIALEMSLEYAGAAVEDRTQELREVNEELSIRTWALADADGRQRAQAGEVEQLRDAVTAARGMHAELQEKLERLTVEAQQTELRLREQQEALLVQQVAYEDDVEMLSMLLEEKEVDYLALEMSLEHASAGADGRTRELSETIEDLRLELSMKTEALTDTSGKLREQADEVEQMRHALTAAEDVHAKLQKDLERATSEGQQTEHRLREQHDALVVQHRAAAEELVEMLSMQLEEKDADHIALEMSLEYAGAAVEDRTQELREVNEELSIRTWTLADADGRQRAQAGEVEQLRDAVTAARGMHAELQEKLERLTVEAQQTELRLREQQEALLVQQVATVAYEDDVEMLSMLLEEKEVDYLALEMSLEHASAGADGRTRELSETIEDLRLELSMKTAALTDTSKLREQADEVEQMRHALTAAEDVHAKLQKDLERATSEGQQAEHRLHEQHDALGVQHRAAAVAAEELVEMLSMQLEEKDADHIALEMSLEHAGAAVEDRTQELREVNEELSIRTWTLADADGRQRAQAGEVEQLRDAVTAARGMHAELQEKLERLTVEAQQTELRLREQQEALLVQQVAYEDDVEMLSMLLEEKEVDYLALEMSLEHASAGADGRTRELSETIEDLRLELSMKTAALTDTSGKLREQADEVEQMRHALTAAEDVHAKLQKDLERATSEGQQTEHRLHEQHDALVVQHRAAAVAAEELVEMLSMQLEEKDSDHIALEMSLEYAGAAVEDRTQELREVNEELSIRTWALADADGRQRAQAGEVEQLRDAVTAARGMHAELQEKLERLTVEAQQTELRLREQQEALLVQQVAYEDDVEMLSMLLEEKEVDYLALEMSLEHASAGADGRTRELSETIEDLRLALSMKTAALTDTSGKLREQADEVEQMRHALTAAEDVHAELQKDLERATSEGQQTEHRLHEQHDALVVQHRAAAVAAEELVEMLSMQLEEKDSDHIALEMSLEYAGAAVEDRTQELREVNEELSIRTWALADADGRQRAQAGEVEQLRDAVTAARGMHAELQEKLERLTVEAQQTELRLREQQEALLVQQVAYEDDVEMLSMLLEEKEVDYLALEMSLEHASAGADGRTRELSETIEDLRLALSMKTAALTDTSGKLREQADEVEQMRHALTAAEDVHAELQKDLERATSEGQQTEHRLHEQHDALVVQHRAAAVAAEELVEMLSMQLEEKDSDHIALEMSLEHAGAAVEDRTQELREVNEELSIRTWALADADGRQRAQAGEVEQLRDAVTAARGMHAELQEKLERLTVEAQQTELRLREQQEALLVQQVATVAYEDDVEMLSMLLEEKEVDYLALEMSLEHASAGADGRTRELSETIEDLRLELSMKTAALTDTSGKLREQADEVEQMRHALTAAEDVHAKLQKDLERATSEGQQTEHRLHEQHDALVVQHRAAAVAAEELVEMLSMQLEEKDSDHIALEMSLEHAGAAVEDRTQELREVNEELSIRTWALADADGRQRAQAGEVEQLRDAVTAARAMHAELQEKLERLTVEAQQTELRLREQQEALLVQQVATVAYEDDVEMLSMLLEEKEVDYLALEMSLEHASAGADGRTRELSETIEDLRLELSMKTAALTDTSGKLREQADEVEQMRHALTAAEDVHAKLQKDLERATSEGQQAEHRLREQHDALVVQHRAAAVAAEELVEMLSMQLEEKDADHIALEMSLEHAGAAVEDRTQELREVNEELSIRTWALADADGRQRAQAREVEQLRDAVTAARGMHAELQEKLERLTVEAQQTELRLREQQEALLVQQVATVAYEDDVEMLSMLLEEKEVDYLALEMSLEHASAGADGRTRELSETIEDLRLELSMKTAALTDTTGKLREQADEVEQMRHALTAAEDVHAELQKDLERATSEGQQAEHRLREQHDALVVQHRAAAVAAEELVEMLSMQLEEKDADHIALEMSLEHAGAAVEDRTQELREVNEELSIRTWTLADADGRQRAQAREVEQLRDAVTAARGMHAELQEKLERLTVEAQQTELRLREQQEALLVQQVATVAYEDDVEMLSMLLEEKEVDYLALEMSLEHASAGADGRTRELSETIEDLRLELSMKTAALTDTSGKLREQADEVEQMRHALTAAEDVHAELQKDLERATSEGQQAEHRLREQHDALVVQHRAAAVAAEELVEMLSMQLEEKDADHIALEMSLEHAGAAVEDRTQELREVSEELSIRTWALADADGRQRAQAGEVEQLRDAVTAARAMHAELQEKLERLTVEAQQTELRLREQQEALLVQQVATVAYEDDVEMLSMLLEEKEVEYLALEMSLEHASAGADGRTRKLSETIEDLRLELSMKTAALTDTSGKLREQADEVEQMRHALTAAEDVHAELQKDLERATSEGQQTEHRLREQHDALVVQHRAAAVAAEELVEMLSMQLEEKDADHIALEMSLEYAGAAVEDRTQELREVNEELSIRTWALADADGRQRAQAGEVEQLRDAVTAARGMHAELQEKLERLTVEAQQTELRLREQQEALLVQQVAYEDDVEMLSMLLEEKEVDYLALEMSLEHASAGADGRTRELSETIEDLRLELSMKTAALTDTSGKLREQADEVEQMRHALTAAEDVHAELQKDLERATSEGQQTEHRLHEQHDALVVQHRAAAVAAEELVEMLSMQLEEKDADHIALEMSLEHAGAAVEDRTQELREVNEELSIRTWALADADGRQRAQAREVEQLRDAVTAARGMHAELQEKLERLTVEAQQTELRLREQQEALLVQQVATVAYEDDVEMLSMLLEEKEVEYLALEMSLEHASAGADGRTRELSETIEDLRLALSMKTAALTDTSGKLREQADEVEQMRHALTAAEDVHAELQKDLERATSEGQQAEHRLREQHDALVVQHRAAAVAAEELVEMLSMQLEEKDSDHIALEMSLEHAGAAVEDRTQELREVSEELSIRTWALADADGRQRAQAGEVEQLRDAVTAARAMHAELQEKLERLTVEAQQTELRLREQQEALLVQQVAYEDDVEMLSMLLEEKEVDYLALEMSLEHASAGADGRTRELSETIEDLRLELSMKTAALTDTSGKLREQADEVEQMRHALTAAEDVHAELQKDLERATSEGQQTEHRLREQHDALVVQHRAAAVAAEELVEMLSMQLEEKDADHIALEMSLEYAGAAVEDRTQELREVNEELSIRTWALADADGRQRAQAREVEQLRDAVTAARGMHAELQEKLERLTVEAQQTELRLREQQEALLVQQVAYEDDVEMLSMLLEEKEVDYLALEMSLEHASAGADGRTRELSETIEDLRLELSMKTAALTDTSGKLREQADEVEQMRHALTAAEDVHAELQKDLERATSEGQQTEHRLREQHDALVVQHRAAAVAAEELVEMLSMQLEEKDSDHIALEMSLEHAGAAVEDRTQELREVNEELSIRTWALADADGRQRAQAGEVEQLRDAVTAARGMHAELQEKLERLTVEAQQTELRLREQQEALLVQQVAYEDDVEMLSMLLEEKEVDYLALEMSLEHASAGADGRTRELSETIEDLRLELSMKTAALTDTSGKLREQADEVEQMRHALTAAEDVHAELQKDLERATSEGQQTEHRLHEQHDALVVQHRAAAVAAEELVEMLSMQLEEKDSDHIALEMSLEHAGAAVEDRTQELREVNEELSIRTWALADADGRQRAQAGEVEQLRDAVTAARGMHAELQEKLERLTVEAQQTELRLREQQEALLVQQVAYEDDVEMLSMLLEEKEVDYLALEMSLEHASAGADGRTRELSETIEDLRLELSMKTAALTDTSGKLREQADEVEQMRHALTAAEDVHAELQKDLERATSEGQQTEHRLHEQHDALVVQHRAAAVAAEELVEMLSMQLEEKDSDHIALEMSLEHAGAAVEDRTQELREVNEELSIRTWALADADGRQRAQAGEVEQLRDAVTAARGMHAELQEKLERLTVEAQQTELRLREQQEALLVQQVAYEDDVEMLSMLLEEKEVDYLALEMSLEHASAGADGRTWELSETIEDLRLELSMKTEALTDISGKLREQADEVEQMRHALTAAEDVHAELQKDLERATSEGQQAEHRLREQHDALDVQHRAAAVAAEELVEMLSMQLEEKDSDHIALEMSLEYAGAAVEDRTQELREVNEELSIRTWALADADGRQRAQAREVEQLRDAVTAARGMHAELQEKLERLTVEAQQTELRLREQQEALLVQQVAYEDDVEMLSMLLEEKEVDYLALEMSLEHASAGADGRTRELSETIEDLRLELSMKTAALTDTSGKLREQADEVEQMRHALTAAEDVHAELQKDLERATSEGQQTEHRLREQHDALVVQHRAAAVAAEELVEMLSMQLEEKDSDHMALEMSLKHAGAAVEDRTQELREVSEELSIRTWTLADADGRQRAQAGEVEQLRDAVTAARGMHAELQEKLERLTVEAQQTELRLREQQEALLVQQVATVAYEDDVEMLSMLLEEKEVDYLALEMSLEHASAGADGRTRELSETIEDLRLALSMKTAALTDTSGKLREQADEVEQMRHALTAAEDVHAKLQKDLERATSEGQQTEHRLREQHDALVVQHRAAAVAAEELVEMLSMQLEEKDSDHIALEMSLEHAGAAVEDRTQELREVSEELSIRTWALADADGRQRAQAGEVEQLRDAVTAARGMHAELQEKLERLTVEAQQTELRLREQQAATEAAEGVVRLLRMQLEEGADHRGLLHFLALARNASDGLSAKLIVVSEELTKKTLALGEQANVIEQLRHALAAAEDMNDKLQCDADSATAEAQQTKVRLLEQQEALAKVHAALAAHEETVEMLHMDLEEKEADIIALDMIRQHADDGAEGHVEELRIDNEFLRLELSVQTNRLAEVNTKLRGHEEDTNRLQHLLTAANSMIAQLQGDLEVTRLDTRQAQLRLHEQHEALIVQEAATSAAEGLLEGLRIQLQEKEADDITLEHLLAHAHNATDGLRRDLDIVTADLRIKTLALSEHANEIEQLWHALGAAQDKTCKLQAELNSTTEEVQQTKLRLREEQDTVAELEAAMTAHRGCVEMLRTQLGEKAESNRALEQSLQQAHDAADDLRRQLSVLHDEVKLRVSSLEKRAGEVQHLREAVQPALDTNTLLQDGRESIIAETQQTESMLCEQHETLGKQHAATLAAEKLVEMLRMQLVETGAGYQPSGADGERDNNETEMGHTDGDDARLSYCTLKTEALRTRLRPHRRLHGRDAATVAASDTKDGRKLVGASEGLCRVHNASSELVRRTDQCCALLKRELTFDDSPDTKVDRVQEGDGMLCPALTRDQPQSSGVLSVSLDSKSGDSNQPGAIGSHFLRTVEGDEHRSPIVGKVASMADARVTVTSRTAAQPITHAAQNGPVGKPAGLERQVEAAGHSGANAPPTIGRGADREFTEDRLGKAHPAAVENPHSIGEARPDECDAQPFESKGPAEACHAHQQPQPKDPRDPSTKQTALDLQMTRNAAADTLSMASIHGRTQAGHFDTAAAADATVALNMPQSLFEDTDAAQGTIEPPHGGQHEKEPPVRTGSAHTLLRLLAKQLQDFTDSFSNNENTRQKVGNSRRQ